MRIGIKSASRVLATIMTVFLLSVSMAAVPVSAGPKVIKVPEDYPTIQDAVDYASPGDKIIVGPGEYFGAIVNKPVEIIGEDGAIIVDGPPYIPMPTMKFGFFLEPEISSGATISKFTFSVDLPVFGRVVDDVTVEHNIMNAPLQGVTCVDGSRWIIKYNDINGLRNIPLGGLGVLIVTTPLYTATPIASKNLVAFNKITGDFPEGGFADGIGLQAEGGPVTGNKVVYNRVVMTGDFPVLAIGMATGDPPETHFFGNMVGFNDLRGSTNEFVFCLPQDLANYNVISRNLGENRAYDGIPPNEFIPII